MHVFVVCVTSDMNTRSQLLFQLEDIVCPVLYWCIQRVANALSVFY